MATLGKILIIEDSKDIQLLLSRLLEGEGYSVVSANNGEEALNLLRSGDDLPHLIFLDLMMPVMDGADFRAEQLLDARLANIPVVLMTAGGDVHNKAASLGITSYLRKPFPSVDTILDFVIRFMPKG